MRQRIEQGSARYGPAHTRKCATYPSKRSVGLPLRDKQVTRPRWLGASRVVSSQVSVVEVLEGQVPTVIGKSPMVEGVSNVDHKPYAARSD